MSVIAWIAVGVAAWLVVAVVVALIVGPHLKRIARQETRPPVRPSSGGAAAHPLAETPADGDDTPSRDGRRRRNGADPDQAR